MYAIRSYYDAKLLDFGLAKLAQPDPARISRERTEWGCACMRALLGIVITSYSIHYTKLYECETLREACENQIRNRPNVQQHQTK